MPRGAHINAGKEGGSWEEGESTRISFHVHTKL